MKRTRIDAIPYHLPREVQRITDGAYIYDSSCSPEARVYYVENGDGLYIKRAKIGSLMREAQMTEYFSNKGLAPSVIGYVSDDADWLITQRARGEDCTHSDYLNEPKRLAKLLGERLRALHELPIDDCPAPNRLEEYLRTADDNFRTGNYDKSQFPDSFGYRSADEAMQVLNEGRGLLRADTLIHGDFCLPNVVMDGWDKYSFIDLGASGIADKHIDLFWGAWTLWFNLGTNEYRDLFFDAYGRDKMDPYLIKVVAAAEVFG